MHIQLLHVDRSSARVENDITRCGMPILGITAHPSSPADTQRVCKPHLQSETHNIHSLSALRMLLNVMQPELAIKRLPVCLLHGRC